MIIHLTNSYNIVKIDHRDKRLSLMEIPGAPYPILLPDNYFILYPGFEQYGMEFTNTLIDFHKLKYFTRDTDFRDLTIKIVSLDTNLKEPEKRLKESTLKGYKDIAYYSFLVKINCAKYGYDDYSAISIEYYTKNTNSGNFYYGYNYLYDFDDPDEFKVMKSLKNVFDNAKEEDEE